MSGSRLILWAALALVLLVGAGIGAYYLMGGENLQGLSDEALLARLETATPAELDPMVFELRARGESVVPLILTAFERRGSDPQVQMQLAESVYRMRPTPRTVQALEQMAQKAVTPEARQRIESLYKDQHQRLQAGRARTSTR